MNNRKSIIIVVVVAIIALIAVCHNRDADGRVYRNKMSLCMDFAQSYLKTVQKTDMTSTAESEKWQMAVDIETDMYNLCLTDLNKEAIGSYKPSAIEKYNHSPKP